MKRNFPVTFLQTACLVITCAGSSLFFLTDVQAATLLMQPSSTKIKLNDVFTVRVFVNTQNKAINNIESVINFPNDILEVVSVDSKSSIFTLWVEQPNFSNASGVVSFNGGVTNPGYTGSGGKLISIVFKAKKEGTASLFFSGSAARENDGMGTDVLSGQNSAEVTIGDTPVSSEKEEKPQPPEKDNEKSEAPKKEEVKENLLGLSVSSPTHPDQNAWFQSKDASFVWKNPVQVNTIQVGLSRQPGTLPTKNLSSDTEKREVSDIDDGVSYFNIRYKNDSGWSEVSSYKLQIDSQAPYNLSLVTKTDEKGNLIFHYTAQDDTSGIQSLRLKIDKGEEIQLPVVKEGDTTLPVSLGKHFLELIAVDKAGNQSSYTTTAQVSVIQPPIFTFYSPQVKFGDSLYVRGESAYADAHINITMRTPHGIIQDYDVPTDGSGKFSFSSESLKLAGEYQLWASILNPDGSKGPISERISIGVLERRSIFSFLGSFLSSMKVVLSLWFLTALSSALGWYKYLLLKRKSSSSHAAKKQKSKE